MMILKYKLNGFWRLIEAQDIQYSLGTLKKEDDDNMVLTDEKDFVCIGYHPLVAFGNRPKGFLSSNIHDNKETVKLVEYKDDQFLPHKVMLPFDTPIYVLQDGKTIEKI